MFINYSCVYLLQVFEYYASYRSCGGQVFMTLADLMWVAVPVFPPNQDTRVRVGSLKGEWPHVIKFCIGEITTKQGKSLVVPFTRVT